MELKAGHEATHTLSLTHAESAKPSAAYHAGRAIGEMLFWAMFCLCGLSLMLAPLLAIQWRRKRNAQREQQEAEARAWAAWAAQQEQARMMALHAEQARVMAPHTERER